MNTLLNRIIIIIVFFGYFSLGQAEIIIMNPEPESRVSGENVLIAASFVGLGNLDPKKIRLLVDGVDLTEESYIDIDMISCLIEYLEPGSHRIDLFGDNLSQPLSWKFISTIEDESIKYSGRIRSSNSIDQIDDQNLSINKITVDFKGSAYDWIDFKTNIKMTSQENQLYQPRNIYGFNLGIKEIFNLKVGDSNPRVSHFTINGKRIRGVELDLNYRWFNLKYVKGELNRAVQGSLTNAYSYSIDKDTLGTKYLALDRTGYTFKQNLSSLRLGIGGDDFRFGLNLLKAKDDTLSIENRLNNAEIYYLPTTLGSIDGLDSGRVYTLNQLGSKARILESEKWSGVGPKDNLVLSSDLGINLMNKRLRIDGEIAFSMTNNNIWGGPLTLSGLDTLVDDTVDNSLSSIDLSGFPNPADYEKYIIINANLSPLVPIDINAFGDSNTVDILDAIFSMPSLAYRGRVITNFFGNYFAIEYSQVGPEFNSLANPYLVKNKRGWSITDKIKLFQNRMMLSIGYKHHDDDILTTVENISSQNTFSFGLNAIPDPRLPTINFTYRSINRDNGVNTITLLTDTTYTDNREKTNTDNFMFNINHRINLLWNHNLSGTFVMIDKKDNFTDRAQNFIDPSMSTNVFNFSINTRYNSPLETTINITTNTSELSTGPGKREIQDFLTINFTAQFPFFNNKILARGGLNYADGSGMVDVSWVGLKGGMRWKILDDLGLNTQAEFRSKETAGISKNTIIARLNLEYSF